MSTVTSRWKLLTGMNIGMVGNDVSVTFKKVLENMFWYLETTVHLSVFDIQHGLFEVFTGKGYVLNVCFIQNCSFNHSSFHVLC